MLFGSCAKDYLRTQSSIAIGTPVALGTLENIELALNGMYTTLGNQYVTSQFLGMSYFNMFNDMVSGSMSVDRHWLWSVDWSFSTQKDNALTADNALRPWTYNYAAILKLNDILTGINAITPTDIEKDLHNNLLGQTLTARAMLYSIMNLHFSPRYESAATAKTLRSVPIRKDVSTGELERATQEEMINFILEDLDTAIAAFEGNSISRPAQYLSGNAAKVLKLRMLMYTGRNEEVLVLAQDIIANSGKSIMGATQYMSGFNSVNNPEWIYGTVIGAGSGVTWTYQGIWLNYNSTHWGQIYGPAIIDLSYVVGTDNSDIKLVADGDGVADKFEGTPPVTKGLTMRDTDIRRALFLEDTKATIEANGLAHYFNEGWTGTPSAYVAQGQNRKFIDMNGDRKADVVMMRLAEVYYIAAEAAALTGNDGLAQTYLSVVAEPYDSGVTSYIRTKTGADLKLMIENYKRVDMFGEGRVFADVKRRGDWVYRFSKYNPIKTVVNGQFKSTTPFLPKSVSEGTVIVYLKDYTTLPIPQAALEGNSLLKQNSEY